ncbi:MAG: CBS domain-containing protein [Syntrophomonadaceae bacterium]|jgi:acetoin utilization protein AcuB|nr:CBS domain-containing protein [Syntrophomonadaceae bacterium]
MVKVKDIMTSRVISIESRKTIGDALELMVENGIRRLPVLAQGTLVGMIVQHDIEKALRSPGFVLETPVDWVMNKDVVTVAAEADLREAIKLLLKHKISGLPVMENGQMAGIISETDILRLCCTLLDEQLA